MLALISILNQHLKNEFGKFQGLQLGIFKNIVGGFKLLIEPLFLVKKVINYHISDNLFRIAVRTI